MSSAQKGMPEILKNHGICSHLVSDHQHYWEDGGATYHTRYSSWECIRGQEGDPWKEDLTREPDRRSVFEANKYTWNFPIGKAMRTHDQVNRRYQCKEELTPLAQTANTGIEFIDINHEADQWFLQIECFDPHEPFFTYEEFLDTAANKPGFIKAMWCGDSACEEKIKDETGGVKSRCIPFEEEHLSDVCVCCGKPAKHMVYWGKQY